MFTYVVLCRDVENGRIIEPYVSGDNLIAFPTLEQAYDSAIYAAEDEATELNIGAVEGVSFGVAEYREGEITTNYYYEDNTEWVTKRIIKQIVQSSKG